MIAILILIIVAATVAATTMALLVWFENGKKWHKADLAFIAGTIFVALILLVTVNEYAQLSMEVAP